MGVEELRSREVYTTVGVHPKEVPSLTRHERELMFQLWDSRRLVGYGEFGLDRTTHPYEWVAQEEFLQELLRWVPPEGVLVLHARGVPRDRLNMESTLRLLTLCQAAGVPSMQFIQLHCFQGSTDLLNRWREAFPNTFFSVNNGVGSFDADQLAGLKSIPSDRLLLETDAPYFAPRGYSHNAPHLLGITAVLVARILGVSPQVLMSRTCDNANKLFFHD
ncbi:uncharacterized metal-dependent hydrolase YabD-like [Mercenaria mercenaria]|uniref:uncharacterized metal-dependent hydrolase YabD-like n=1 Tax=Mercenaria mercenaria TaxID=6596 RepID=UPI00234F47B7|nr:uncharacterized metal-dependent hydrolase YabD-like [Mercenaria mercenaria]